MIFSDDDNNREGAENAKFSRKRGKSDLFRMDDTDDRINHSLAFLLVSLVLAQVKEFHL